VADSKIGAPLAYAAALRHPLQLRSAYATGSLGQCFFGTLWMMSFLPLGFWVRAVLFQSLSDEHPTGSERNESILGKS